MRRLVASRLRPCRLVPKVARSCVDGDLVIAPGGENDVVRSLDSGDTFEPLAGVDIVVVGETILRSRDAGATWRSEAAPTQDELFAIPGNAKHVWVLGASAAILRGRS